MGSLLSFLLRNGGGILRESAEIFIGQALIRAATERLRNLLIFYAVLLLFALASLAFFYVLLYRWLATRMDDTAAAAIMFGANLFLIGAMLIGKALMKPKAPELPNFPVLELIKSQLGGFTSAAPGTKPVVGQPDGSHFQAGMAIGQQIGQHVRKAAPKIALGAGLLGIVIGFRPQLLGLFRSRKKPTR